MAELKKLQKNGTDIYPVTLEDVVFDSDGNTLPNKYQTKSDDTLNTVDKTVIGAINEVNTELAEVKQSVSNGKSLIASAITDKGIETLSDATFQTMADNIGLIEGGEKSNLPSWCPNFWIEGEPSKVAMGLSSASINNEIYLIGGRDYDSVSATYYTDVNAYNIEKNTWSKKTTIPTPRCWLTSNVINNKIYSIGGYTSTGVMNTNECYDASTGTWSSKTSLPLNVYHHTSSVVSNNIYIIGGYWSSNTSNNYCYDTLTDTWSAKAKTSTNRYKPTSNAIGDKIYCMGGYVNNVYNDNLCYDTLTDTWSTKSSMLTATYGLVSEVINNKIYCIGGSSSLNPLTLKNAIEVYDINTDSWKEEGSIKTPRYDFISEMVNDIIYTFCGYTTTSLDITEGYVVAEDIKLGSEEVRSGKELIATAITNKGVTTNNDDSFQTMADNIGLIEGGESIDLPEWLKKTIWLRAKDFNYYIALSASCVVDKNIYIIGGYVNTVSSKSATESQYFYYYNTSTNEYISMPNMLSRRYLLTASSVGTCIYAIGGSYDGLHDKNECFDTSNVNNGWVTKTAMPTKRASLTSSVVNNKIYCIGGDAFKTSTTATISDINECYDPLTDTWTTKTDMPNKRYNLTSSVVNNKIYCIGGEHATLNKRNINEEYDPSTDSWTTKTEMITNRLNLSSSVVNNKIYCIGGKIGSSVLNTNECYDPLTDSWTTKSSIETTLEKSIAETVGNCIYIIGGRNNDSYLLNTNYCYIPKNDN